MDYARSQNKEIEWKTFRSFFNISAEGKQKPLELANSDVRSSLQQVLNVCFYFREIDKINSPGASFEKKVSRTPAEHIN